MNKNGSFKHVPNVASGLVSPSSFFYHDSGESRAVQIMTLLLAGFGVRSDCQNTVQRPTE